MYSKRVLYLLVPSTLYKIRSVLYNYASKKMCFAPIIQPTWKITVHQVMIVNCYYPKCV